MAQMTLDIEDEKYDDLLQAFAETYGLTADMELTQEEFARTKIIEMVKQVYSGWVTSKAIDAARDAASDETIEVE